MPRPKKYHTPDEKKAGAAARARKSYEKRRDAVCAKRRDNYAETVVVKAPARVPLTEEEKRIRHCKSSKESYHRRKSEIAAQRRAGPSVLPPAPLNSSFRGGLTHTTWRFRLNNLKIRITNALDGRSPASFSHRVLKQCITAAETTVAVTARQGFHGLDSELSALEHNVLNTFGVGSQMAETTACRARVRETIGYLEEISMAQLEDKPLEELLSDFASREQILDRASNSSTNVI